MMLQILKAILEFESIDEVERQQKVFCLDISLLLHEAWDESPVDDVNSRS